MDKDKERYLKNKAKREGKKLKQELSSEISNYAKDNYELDIDSDEPVTEEEKKNLIEDFMRKLGEIPFINDLADKAANRLERRQMKKAEKRGMKMAQKMKEDRELSRQLFMQTLLEKVREKNKEIERQGGKDE